MSADADATVERGWELVNGYARELHRLADQHVARMHTSAPKHLDALSGAARQCREDAAAVSAALASSAAAEAAAAHAQEMRKAIDAACEIIETGDQRLLAMDGPTGGQPPELSLDEWRTLYVTLDAARGAVETTTEPDPTRQRR